MMNINKIKKNIQKIRKIVDKQGRYGYYLMYNNEDNANINIKLVSKGDNLDDLKNKVIHKIDNNSCYIKCPIYLVELLIEEKYIDNPKEFIIGPVRLRIKQSEISKKFKIITKAVFKNGTVWYTNKDLLNGKFHFTDFKRLIKEIHMRYAQYSNY